MKINIMRGEKEGGNLCKCFYLGQIQSLNMRRKKIETFLRFTIISHRLNVVTCFFTFEYESSQSFHIGKIVYFEVQFKVYNFEV